MKQNIFKIETETDLLLAYSLLKSLRPQLTQTEFMEIYRQASRRDDYALMGMRIEGQLVALLGCRILFDFIRGKHLYIDDLITLEGFRSQGLGTKLLKAAEEHARLAGCLSLRLCTGIDNHRAVKFYESNGWKRNAFAFKKRIEEKISI